MVRVYIAGDVVPNNRTLSLFYKRQTKELFGEMIPIINRADIKVVNLEAPVVYDKICPIKKSGPSLFCYKETIDVLKEAGFNVITLANNHFRDQGDSGVNNTISLISALGLNYVGGGNSYEEARKILYYTVGDSNTKVAIINACEHEFSIASENKGGSNPLDIIAIYNDIIQARTKADYVMVIVHGGIELYQLPTPRMKKIYRFFIDAGADVVVNHHQHCFSGYELYKGKPIFYGLGNFCFDWENRRNTLWNFGYAVSVQLDERINFDIHPYIQCNEAPVLSCINKNDVLDEIEKLNSIILDDGLLFQSFRNYAQSKEKDFLYRISPYTTRYLRALYKRDLLKDIYSKSKLYVVKNLINCESHREVFLEMLNAKIG